MWKSLIPEYQSLIPRGNRSFRKKITRSGRKLRIPWKTSVRSVIKSKRFESEIRVVLLKSLFC